MSTGKSLHDLAALIRLNWIGESEEFRENQVDYKPTCFITYPPIEDLCETKKGCIQTYNPFFIIWQIINYGSKQTYGIEASTAASA